MISAVKINGGLGNQMFQYCFYLSLKKRNPISIILIDPLDSFYNGHEGFALPNSFPKINTKSFQVYKLVHKICRFLVNHNLITEVKENEHDFYSFKEKYINNTSDAYYCGFWQSEKYFASVSEQVKILFSFDWNNIYSKDASFFIKAIQRTNSVSIHIRRGDYLHKGNERFNGLCTSNYYRQAIEYMQSRIDNPIFFVFSDDIEWAKQNFSCNYHVDCFQQYDHWKDMALMSLCKHNIIANSTFSWWGAWLNDNKNKIVIAPRLWTKCDRNNYIVPENWVKI